jgi:SNW domain-containing protein 1
MQAGIQHSLGATLLLCPDVSFACDVLVLPVYTGGAYPELPLLQYPLDMGRPEEQRGKQTLAVAVDIEGNANYDAIVRQGARANKVIHTGHQALIPKVDLLDPQVCLDGRVVIRQTGCTTVRAQQ